MTKKSGVRNFKENIAKRLTVKLKNIFPLLSWTERLGYNHEPARSKLNNWLRNTAQSYRIRDNRVAYFETNTRDFLRGFRELVVIQ